MKLCASYQVLWWQTVLWLIKHWFSASTFVVKTPPSPSPKPLAGQPTTSGFVQGWHDVVLPKLQ